jgi:regulation of enolase protein 1 (concanavalin A-like superfamily)
MKIGLIVLIAIILAGGCKDTPVSQAEDCSIILDGVTFTRSLNKAHTLSTLDNGKLLFNSPAKSDYFNEPDQSQSYGNAPVLLTKADMRQPFTFTVKLTPGFKDTYDAGALYVYVDNDHWFKFAFEQDERKQKRIVTVRTIGTSDDNNHDTVDSASVHLKISSDTKTIGFYYSADNENWQLVRLYRNEFPVEAMIGLSSQSPIGSGTRTIFEQCTLTKTSIQDFRLGR